MTAVAIWMGKYFYLWGCSLLTGQVPSRCHPSWRGGLAEREREKAEHFTFWKRTTSGAKIMTKVVVEPFCTFVCSHTHSLWGSVGLLLMVSLLSSRMGLLWSGTEKTTWNNNQTFTTCSIYKYIYCHLLLGTKIGQTLGYKICCLPVSWWWCHHMNIWWVRADLCATARWL